jgi:RimJ/RimL family protein N-acetyltransferase
VTTTPKPDFATKPTLTGERVVLRPFRPDDLPAMGEILADPELLRLTGSVSSTAEANSQPTELDEVGRAWYLSRNDQTDRLDLAITPKESGLCVGEAVLNEYDADNLSCNFRILIGPRGRGAGLGSEATRLLVGHAFDTLGLHRVTLTVFAFNPRAHRVYEKAGFREEGRAREAFRYDGVWYDDIHMAQLASEWRSRNQASGTPPRADTRAERVRGQGAIRRSATLGT